MVTDRYAVMRLLMMLQVTWRSKIVTKGGAGSTGMTWIEVMARRTEEECSNSFKLQKQ